MFPSGRPLLREVAVRLAPALRLPGSKRREEERDLRERMATQVAQAEAAERVRAQILAEREADAVSPRVSVRAALWRAAWRNRTFLAPFVVLALLGAVGWWSFWPLLLWAGGSAWWWVGLGHMPQDWAEPAAAPEWGPVPEPDDIPHRWAAKVAADGRFLAGAEIVDTRVLPHADRYTVQLEPGKHTVEGVGGNLSLLSSGLRTPLAKIVWEPHPDYAEEDSTVARLTIVRHNVREEVRYLRRPEFRDGVVFLGDHVDLDGQAGWTVYAENSIRGGLVAGSPDTGKSRLLDTLAASIMSPEFQERWPTHVLYVDGQNGNSSPLLWDHATLSVGPYDADEMVRAILRMGDSRQAWGKTYGAQGFNPGQSPRDGVEGLAGWLIIVDESHVIWPRDRVEPWTRVAREKRKNGLGLISSGHVTDLSGFGEDDALRASLLRGNGVVFHIGSTMAGSRIPGLPTPPHKLPKIRGYFQAVPGEEVGGRCAPARGLYSPNAEEKAKAAAKGKPVPVDVPTLEEQFARAVRPPVCDMDAKALGVVYTHREERAAAKAEQGRAIAEGREPPPEREQIVAGRTPAAPEPEATAEQVTTTGDAVLAYLRQNPEGATRGEIAAAISAKPDTVTKACAVLAGRNEIVRIDGRWKIPATPDTEPTT